jgi:hypothetical protein
MENGEKPSSSVMEYFRALRAEIIQAQKLRVQVGLAKVVFLGSLFGFFLRDERVNPGILICPFVALMFDCMVYGLSFNIRDLGAYIAEIEPLLKPPRNVAFWQTYRTQREKEKKRKYRDWGRIIYRAGNYGFSIAALLLSFWRTRHPIALISVWWLLPLGLMLGAGWGILVWLEFHRRNPKTGAAQNEENGANA